MSWQFWASFLLSCGWRFLIAAVPIVFAITIGSPAPLGFYWLGVVAFVFAVYVLMSFVAFIRFRRKTRSSYPDEWGHLDDAKRGALAADIGTGF
jgi:hypothetical protein